MISHELPPEDLEPPMDPKFKHRKVQDEEAATTQPPSRPPEGGGD